MKFFQFRFREITFLIALLSAVCYGQIGERDASKEEPYYQALMQASPKAVESFKTATLALDAGNDEAAIAGFNDVLKQVPSFEPAMRRLGYALADSGKRDEGIAMGQKALDITRSSDNLIGLATTLVFYGNANQSPNSADLQKAFNLVNEAAKKNSDGETLSFLAELSLRVDRLDDFNKAVDKLVANFPDLPATHFFNAIRFADAGRFSEGIAEAKLAASKGMPEEETTRLITSIEAARNEAYPWLPYTNYIYGFIGIVLLWLFGLLALYLLGKSFSAKTLKLLEESDPNDVTGGGHANMKNSYRKLITFAGIYYYISQPIVIVLVVVATAAVLFASFVVGRIPIF